MIAAATGRDSAVLEQLRERQVRLALGFARLIGIVAPVFALLILVLWFFLRQYPQLLITAASIVPLSAVSWSYPALHRRQRSRRGIWLLLLGILLVLGFVFLLLPEVLIGLSLGYVLLVLLACTLLDDRESRWFILATAAVFVVDLALTTLLQLRLFAPIATTPAAIIAVLLGAAVLLAAAVLIRQSTQQQEKDFRRAQEANLEVQALAAAEAGQRKRLETTVEGYVAAMADVGRGDLSGRVPLDEQEHSADDPLQVLGLNLNETIASLQRMTLQVHQTASSLGSSTSEILAAATQQTAGAVEQSTAIAQASTTIDEVRAIAEQTAQRAQGVAGIAQRTANVSQAGEQALADTIASVGAVRQKVEAIAHGILALSEQAQSIGQIITAVSDIASQSSMLALNAAVEAARAGESGKGFAVVASEVRGLAEQSRAATAQVKDILTEIQRGVNTAVMLTEEGMKGADSGVRVAGLTGESIRRLAEGVTESAQAALQIAAAAGQQVTGMEQIAQAMNNIQQVTGQTVASTRQTEGAAAELNSLAAQLRHAVEQYRL